MNVHELHTVCVSEVPAVPASLSSSAEAAASTPTGRFCGRDLQLLWGVMRRSVGLAILISLLAAISGAVGRGVTLPTALEVVVVAVNITVMFTL
jgi:hypothetical protein